MWDYRTATQKELPVRVVDFAGYIASEMLKFLVTPKWLVFPQSVLEADNSYQILRQCTYLLPPHLQEETATLDALCWTGVMLADRKCQKLPTGAVASSPTVQKARERVEIWSLLLKKKLGRHVSSSLCCRGMHHHHISTRLCNLSLTQIVEQHRLALHEYRTLKKSSVALRQSFLEELAEARVAEGNLTAASKLRQLHTHEYQ
jgi:hypothetical protein